MWLSLSLDPKFPLLRYQDTISRMTTPPFVVTAAAASALLLLGTSKSYHNVANLPLCYVLQWLYNNLVSSTWAQVHNSDLSNLVECVLEASSTPEAIPKARHHIFSSPSHHNSSSSSWKAIQGATLRIVHTTTTTTVCIIIFAPGELRMGPGVT